MATTRRTETEEARRGQILAAARKVLAAKGYDRATVADIVAAAGVAQGTFYLYFPSKKAVVTELADMYMSKLAQQVMAAYDEARPLAECIRSMVHACFAVCSENRDLARLIRFTLEAEGPEAVESLQARQDLMSETAGILARRMASGEVNPMDPDLAMQLIGGLMRDATHECYVFSDGSQAQRYEDTLVALVTNALLRKERSP